MPISFSRTLQDEGVVAPRGVGGAGEVRVGVVEGGVEGGDVGRGERTGWGRGGGSVVTVVTEVTTAKHVHCSYLCIQYTCIIYMYILMYGNPKRTKMDREI